MNEVPPVDMGAERWLRSSVRVYLEGDKDFRWISRVVRGTEKDAAMLLLTTFGRFSGTTRYRKLLRSLRESVTKSAGPTVWVLPSA
jgi:hypothetical protein